MPVLICEGKYGSKPGSGTNHSLDRPTTREAGPRRGNQGTTLYRVPSMLVPSPRRRTRPMSNIASALKEEIVRLARKEIPTETESLKKASAQYRPEIATLKKRVIALEKRVARFNKSATTAQKAKATTDKPARVRFSAKGLITLRQRLGLSGGDMGALLGVSAQTIYNWEAEKSRPRQLQLDAFASVRGLGKRQAAAKLQELAG